VCKGRVVAIEGFLFVRRQSVENTNMSVKSHTLRTPVRQELVW